MSKELVTAIESVAKRNPDLIVSTRISRQPKGKKVFMGIGALSKGEINPGLGLGVLIMLIAATSVVKQTNENIIEDTQDDEPQVDILVADTHAEKNGTHISKNELADRTDSLKFSLEKSMKLLGCSARVFKASENPDYHFDSTSTSYADLESHDVMVAHKQGAGVKLGWKTMREALSGVVARDEPYFDKIAIQQYPNELDGLSFLYTREGLAPEMRRGEHLFIPPYIGRPGMILGEQIVINDLAKMSNQMGNYLSLIGRKAAFALEVRRRSLDLLQEVVDGLR